MPFTHPRQLWSVRTWKRELWWCPVVPGTGILAVDPLGLVVGGYGLCSTQGSAISCECAIRLGPEESTGQGHCFGLFFMTVEQFWKRSSGPAGKLPHWGRCPIFYSGSLGVSSGGYTELTFQLVCQSHMHVRTQSLLVKHCISPSFLVVNHFSYGINVVADWQQAINWLDSAYISKAELKQTAWLCSCIILNTIKAGWASRFDWT